MTRNDITGDKIATKPATEKYRDGWAAIFAPVCTRCSGAHLLAQCNWPLVAEEGKKDE